VRRKVPKEFGPESRYWKRRQRQLKSRIRLMLVDE
jgi:rRNA maturation protein Nop10